MKCTNCDSYNVFVDAEEDLFFCMDCEHVEGVDYKAIPEEILKKHKVQQ